MPPYGKRYGRKKKNKTASYLSGMLDVFFDGKLTPFIETNRGCPFKCSFCHTGNNYFNKNYFNNYNTFLTTSFILSR